MTCRSCGREAVCVLVPIPAGLSYTGEARWAAKPVDACIAPILFLLNFMGPATASSCCGHGRAAPMVIDWDAGRRMQERCDCHDDHESKPTDWVSGASIPHHCDCPLYPWELPDADAAPTAFRDATRQRDKVLGWGG